MLLFVCGLTGTLVCMLLMDHVQEETCEDDNKTYIVTASMEAIKPLERLRIQGNPASKSDSSMNKTEDASSSELNKLPDIMTSKNSLFNKLGHLRRYVFPDRAALSELNGRAKEDHQVRLNVRGKTIYWDTEFNVSSPNFCSVQDLNSKKHTSCKSDEMNEATLTELPSEMSIENSTEISSKALNNTLLQINHATAPVVYVMNRNNKLRHSYHGVGSLSLTGQKLTTPRDFNEQPRAASQTLFISSEREEPLLEPMPNISGSSPVHKRCDRPEAKTRVALQRVVHSAVLKQCLQIQKPQKHENNTSLLTSVDNLKGSFISPLTNGETKTDTEVTELKRYQFNSLDSYILFNAKNHQQDYPNHNGISARAPLTSQMSSSSSARSFRGNGITYPSVKKYPNMNGQTSVAQLSVVGFSPIIKSQTDKDVTVNEDIKTATNVAKFSINGADISQTKDSTKDKRTMLSNDSQLMKVSQYESSEDFLDALNHEFSLTCIPLNNAGTRKKDLFS
ncbi:uncharacterized protein LOC106050577 isoform X1 [Biomphalaria glabrata]|uniref:Uncharacterized protein LOC106050577 isoform X1 n=2 Tax=Biomphalaria glabrata TaxID=6526 RepID=A0A9U8DTX0_BIOGL|nr:uncharacterized protein LOC106050577 isoform X1 [Biomphalaria glabrata]